jgi:hypothetical protein
MMRSSDAKRMVKPSAAYERLRSTGYYLPSLPRTKPFFTSLYAGDYLSVNEGQLQKLNFNPRTSLGLTKADVWVDIGIKVGSFEKLASQLGFNYDGSLENTLPNIEYMLVWASKHVPTCDVIQTYIKHAPMSQCDDVDDDASISEEEGTEVIQKVSIPDSLLEAHQCKTLCYQYTVTKMIPLVKMFDHIYQILTSDIETTRWLRSKQIGPSIENQRLCWKVLN